MKVQRLLATADRISTFAGKTFAWLIVLLMLVVCVEVFKRYIMNAPTAFIYDINNMMYGTLFMMCGAYTLAQNGHVRGDFLYGSMKPRMQASLDLALYILFFLPGIIALVKAGYDYAGDSWRIREHSNVYLPALAGVNVTVVVPRPRFGIWTLTPSPLMRKPCVVSSLLSTTVSVVPTATVISEGWKANRSAVTSTVCSGGGA